MMIQRKNAILFLRLIPVVSGPMRFALLGLALLGTDVFYIFILLLLFFEMISVAFRKRRSTAEDHAITQFYHTMI